MFVAHFMFVVGFLTETAHTTPSKPETKLTPISRRDEFHDLNEKNTSQVNTSIDRLIHLSQDFGIV